MATIYVSDKNSLPERVKQDVYPTKDIGLIKAALWRYAPTTSKNILDIGAGDGRWGQLAKSVFCPKAELTGVDIRDISMPKGFDNWHPKVDFSLPIEVLIEFEGYKFDLVVGNPPFYCASQIIKNVWPLMANNSIMILLLKLEFMASQTRYKYLWPDFSPVDVDPIVKRIQFTDTPQNPNAYGIFVWQKHEGKNAAVPCQWRTRLLWHEREIRE